MTNTSNHQLSDNLIWSLRALAQEAEVQFNLYQCYHEAADELVLDFGDHLPKDDPNFLKRNNDIRKLDNLILSKSGMVGYWDADAMLHTEFWANIRETAKEVLIARGLPLSAPEPLDIVFINVDSASAGTGILARLKGLFRR